MKTLTQYRWLVVLSLMFSISVANFSLASIQVKSKDCANIQNAINNLPPSGGEVILSSGVYTCLSPIVINRNNVVLRGEGNATVLQLGDQVNAPVLVMGRTEAVPQEATKHIKVSHLTIDGNRDHQSQECMGGECSGEFPLRNNGISIRRCVDCSVESVVVHSAISGGLVTELGCRRLTIRDYTSYNNAFDGLAGYETEDSTFSGINLYDNKAAGISTDIKFNNNKFYDVTISDNKSVGIFMRDSSDNSFTNLHIRNSQQHGIFLAQVNTDPETAAAGNTFTSVVISNSGGAGIQANDKSCVNNMIVGAQYINNKSCVGEASSGLIENVGAICR